MDANHFPMIVFFSNMPQCNMSSLFSFGFKKNIQHQASWILGRRSVALRLTIDFFCLFVYNNFLFICKISGISIS